MNIYLTALYSLDEDKLSVNDKLISIVQIVTLSFKSSWCLVMSLVSDKCKSGTRFEFLTITQNVW